MGEAQGTLFQPEFNRAIKVQTFDQKITSHAGAVLLRETDHQLGLVESLTEQITDPRHPDKIRYTAEELIRERIYAMALGDEDQDDLDRLAHDPAMRMATWNRPGQEVLEQRLASQPTQSRLIDWLADVPGNREALRYSLFDWTHRHLRSTGRKHQAYSGGHAVMRATIDIDKPDPKTGQLRLFPRYFFLITNWPQALRSGEQLLAHYRQRGTFEDRLGEFNAVIGPHLSSSEFIENEVAMLLSLLAFNLTTMLRNELEAATGGSWDLQRFQQTVLRAGGRVTTHARRVWLSVEASVGGFWSVLTKRIARLTLSSRWSPPTV